MRDAGSNVDLRVTRDGQEAMDVILRQGADAKDRPAALPDLILLDLHLPRLSGLDVLKRLRAMPETRYLPVVVWSTSRQEEDVRDVYQAGANSYIQKPRDFPQYRDVLEGMLRYWFQIVQLPPSQS
jgi:CheY-like chemotaxis protein